jgi:hypothetical protein
MIRKKKTCLSCNTEQFIFSKNRCKSCASKEDSKPIKKVSTKQTEKNKDKALKTKELHSWFLTLFDKHKEKDAKGYFVRCFETGFKMYEDNYKYNSCIYSHYFPKSTYPQYAFEEWNMELVTPDTHSTWEQDHTKCSKMYKKYLELKEKVLYL